MIATLPIDPSTLKTAQRIARERDCSVEEVVRTAVSEYADAQLHLPGLPQPSEPDTELAVTIPMPLNSRAVTIRIANRSALQVKPILPEFEDPT